MFSKIFYCSFNDIFYMLCFNKILTFVFFIVFLIKVEFVCEIVNQKEMGGTYTYRRYLKQSDNKIPKVTIMTLLNYNEHGGNS